MVFGTPKVQKNIKIKSKYIFSSKLCSIYDLRLILLILYSFMIKCVERVARKFLGGSAEVPRRVPWGSSEVPRGFVNVLGAVALFFMMLVRVCNLIPFSYIL